MNVLFLKGIVGRVRVVLGGGRKFSVVEIQIKQMWGLI